MHKNDPIINSFHSLKFSFNSLLYVKSLLTQESEGLLLNKMLATIVIVLMI